MLCLIFDSIGMNIYLDIDGVLLKKDGEPSDGVLEFLKYVTDNHSVYWLTTHCRGGENNAVEYLLRALPAESREYLDKIIPTDWQTLKTEAIDFSQDFRWFDDYSMQAELNVLAENNAKDKLVLVDLKSAPDKLNQFIKKLHEN